MARRMMSQRISASAVTLALVSGTIMACDSAEDPNEDGHFYCTDASGTVIDEDYCDDSNGNDTSGFFFMYMGSSLHGSTTYPVGSRVPAGAQRFSVTDKAARTRFGLPSSGKITNGTVKTGVVGKGGPGSTAKVGSGSSGGKVGGGKGSSGG